MKQYKKIAISLVSLILCLSMLFPIFTISAHEEETKYVKDLKIIYADSIKEAKEQLPSGYQLVDGNKCRYKKGGCVCLLQHYN
jgi:uncharacterized protein YpmS